SSKRDWSSDVCSSDLAADQTLGLDRHLEHAEPRIGHPLARDVRDVALETVGQSTITFPTSAAQAAARHVPLKRQLQARLRANARSEERRVGEECTAGR